MNLSDTKHSRSNAYGRRQDYRKLIMLATMTGIMTACAGNLDSRERCEIPSAVEPPPAYPLSIADQILNWGNVVARIRGEAIRRNEGCIQNSNRHSAAPL